MDIKIAPIPISITASALTELTWILGGFGGSKSSEDVGQRGPQGVEAGPVWLRPPRATESPLMPVKVIYKRPSKVRGAACPARTFELVELLEASQQELWRLRLGMLRCIGTMGGSTTMPRA